MSVKEIFLFLTCHQVKGYFKKYIFCYNHAVVFTVSAVISFINEFGDYKAHVINLADFLNVASSPTRN